MGIPEKLSIQETKAKIFASYAGIVTGFLLPFSIAVATYLFNKEQSYDNEQQSCIRESIEISGLLAKQPDISSDDRESWRGHLATNANVLNRICLKVGVQLPETITTELKQITKETSDPAIAATAQQAISDSNSQATTSSVNSLNNLPARIYIHISSETQRDAAKLLQSQINGRKIGAQSVIAPGVQLIRSYRGPSELRCFQAEDCQKEAPLIQIEINKLLNRPRLELRNLSQDYKGSTEIRPHHFEIWFGPGEIDSNKKQI